MLNLNSTKKREIHIEISSQCSLHCIHCSSQSIIEKNIIAITEKEVKSIVEYFSFNRNLIICFTGGEPFLSDKLIDYSRNISRFPSVTGIGFFTSGCNFKDNFVYSFSMEDCVKLVSSGINFCYVSLHSDREKTHDAITGVEGSYKATLKTIKLLQEKGISVRINFVLMKFNVSSLEKTLKFFETLKIDELRILRLVKHGKAIQNWDILGLSRDQQKELILRILKIKKFEDYRYNVTIAGFPEIIHCRPFKIGKYCQAGIDLFYIDSLGDIYPCACMKNSKKFLGNIFNSNETYLISNKKFHKNCFQDL